MSEKNRVNDLSKLKDFKDLEPFQMLLISELRSINHSLSEISNIMNENSAIENEEGLNSICHKIFGSIDDLSRDLSDMFDELKTAILEK